MEYKATASTIKLSRAADNYPAWSEEIIKLTRMKFCFWGESLRTGVKKEFQFPEEPESRKGASLSDQKWIEDYKTVNAKQTRYDNDAPLVLGLILGEIFRDSELLISQHRDYLSALTDDDVLGLWKLIRDLHIPKPGTVNAIRERIDFNLAQNLLDKKPDEDELVYRFLHGLNPTTYGKQVAQWTAEGSFPDTLAEAQELVIEWHDAHVAAGLIGAQHSSHARDDSTSIQAQAHSAVHGSKPPCLWCNVKGHYAQECRGLIAYKSKNKSNPKENKEHKNALLALLDDDDIFKYSF